MHSLSRRPSFYFVNKLFQSLWIIQLPQACFICRGVIGIMDNPVHDGICLRSAAGPAMPSIDRALSGKGGGMVSAALSKQLIGVPMSFS